MERTHGGSAYQLVLISGDGDEDCLSEYERLAVLNVANKRLGVALQHKPHSRLILVHRVQDDLQRHR